MRLFASAVLLLAALGIADAQATRWSGVGVIMAMLPAPSPLHATRPVVVLEHEAIQGLMEERMSMPFIVDSVALFGDLKIGERVAFELVDTPGALLVVRLDRLKR